MSEIEPFDIPFVMDANRTCNDRTTDDRSYTVCSEVPDDKANCDFAKKDESESSVEPEPQPLALLDPEHPLLRKFQENLRAHLLHEKEQLSLDISELKFVLKEKEQQCEDLGSNLYDMQSELEHQNNLMEQHADDIKKNTESRAKEEELVSDLKCEVNKAMCINKEQKNMYNKKALELENMQQLEARLRKWTDQFEDEVKNAKRVVSRDAQLQKQLSEEKRQTDLLFYHLDIEVKKREKELRGLEDEALDMKEIVKELNSSLACANTDLEVLQSEQKRLTQAWGEVIVAIQYRDKILAELTQQFNKDREDMKLTRAGIEGTKKQITKESEENAKLTAFRAKIMDDCAILKVNLAKETTTLKDLVDKFEEFPVLTERLEADLLVANREGQLIEKELRRVQNKVDKQNRIKADFEEQILKFAEDQLISDKASAHRMKLLNQLQQQRRTIELTMVQGQNNLSSVLLDIERLKGILSKQRDDYDKKSEILRKKDEECDGLSTEIKNIETQMELKMKKMEKLNKQLDATNLTTGDSNRIDLKIKQAERAVSIIEQQVTEHQQFWILLQNHYVNLTQKRSAQLNEIQVTRKQLSIIRQKSYKIDLDLESSSTNIHELSNEINQFTKKITLLNEKAFTKNMEHAAEETNCAIEHGELMEKLRESEMAVLGLEADITDLHSEIEHYKDIVLDKHHEALSWETKFKLIDETLRWRKDEVSMESELGQMKTEIHRMEIRYNHLRKAQDKLVQDLDLCILHRENVFVNANLQLAMQTKNQKKHTISATQQKVNDMQNKLKQIQHEINKVQSIEIKKLKSEQDGLYREVTLLHNQIQEEMQQIKQICEQIEEEKLRKFFNLEQIVRRQTRAKYYRQLVINRTPPKIARSETSLEVDTQKQVEINENMTDLLQILANEFPKVNHWFNKIAQILKD